MQPKPIQFPLRCGQLNWGHADHADASRQGKTNPTVLQGNSVVNKPLKSEVELCHYTGSLRGAKGSWAALSTCDGIEGVLYDGSTMHHIARLEQPELASHLENPHYVYSERHLKETNHTCGFHDTPGYHEHVSPEVKKPSSSFIISIFIFFTDNIQNVINDKSYMLNMCRFL